MDLTKKAFVLLALGLAIGFLGCTREQKAEAPKQEQITKSLVPAKVSVTGPAFLVELEDLTTIATMDTASKEIVETPLLRGNMKITNKSKDNLDIQAVTFDYFDGAGNPIHFSSGEKAGNAYAFWRLLKPGETTEGRLEVTIPRGAIKGKALEKIEANLVYVASPLNRETLTLPEKIE